MVWLVSRGLLKDLLMVWLVPHGLLKDLLMVWLVPHGLLKELSSWHPLFLTALDPRELGVPRSWTGRTR